MERRGTERARRARASGPSPPPLPRAAARERGNGGLGTSHETMASLGLWYVRERWLQSSGRWHSVDPVPTEPAYQYVRNMPTMAVDASGRGQPGREWVGWWSCSAYPEPERNLPHLFAWDNPSCLSDSDGMAHYGHRYVWPSDSDRELLLWGARTQCEALANKGRDLVHHDLKKFHDECETKLGALANRWTWGEIVLGAVSVITGIVSVPATGGLSACAAAVSLTSGVASTAMTVGYARFCRRPKSCCAEIEACMQRSLDDMWGCWEEACKSGADARFAATETDRCLAFKLADLRMDQVTDWYRRSRECEDLCKP